MTMGLADAIEERWIDDARAPREAANVDPPSSRVGRTLFSREAALRVGVVFADRYRLVAYLGRGALGTTWIARVERGHKNEPHQVALKIMTACAPLDSSREAAFRHQVCFASELVGPHTTRIVDHGVADETPFVAVELLDGETLERHLRRVRRLSARQCLWLLRHLTTAIVEAHAEGLLHGELHPSNLFLATQQDTPEPLLKVLDFGIARRTLLDPTRTDARTLSGWPHDTSPEQRSNPFHLDVRSDLWAMAAILYRCLTGVKPFNPHEEWHRSFVPAVGFHAPPPSALVPGVPIALDEFFHLALHEDRERRYQSAAAMLDAFEKAMGGDAALRPTEVQSSEVATGMFIAEATPAADDLASLDANELTQWSEASISRSRRKRSWRTIRALRRNGRTRVSLSSRDGLSVGLVGLMLFAGAMCVVAVFIN
ncbi:MAG: serine/threonine protein kinase [Polyangiaceae bacterium]|nr:serine/threonine protein kinase [Polyangiaceae bacterium]